MGSLGGTITMVEGPHGAEPRLGAQELMDGLAGDDFSVDTETLEQMPGASLAPGHIVRAVAWAERQVASDAAGVVLVQGTDTLSESAFLADLYWDGAAPLVFTGAMRLASAAGADGPGNLVDACVAASRPEVGAQGVVVCMGGELHRAGRVQKSHSWGVHAFTSGPAGLAGVVREGEVHVYASRRGRESRPLGAPIRDPHIAVLKTFLGDDGRILDQLLDSAQVDGVVVEGYGAGHVPAEVADVLARAAEVLPVIVCTSASRGGTLRNTYGFRGSERDLLDRGVALGGALSAHHARLLLWAWLAQDQARSERIVLPDLLETYAEP